MSANGVVANGTPAPTSNGPANGPTNGTTTGPATANGTAAPAAAGGYSAAQIAQLRAQVTVYKMLARNEAIPSDLAAVAMTSSSQPLVEKTNDLMEALERHHKRWPRSTTVPIPVGMDPVAMMEERENRIANRIGLRIEELSNLHVPEHLRIKADIELRALRLINFQAQIRAEVMGALKRDTTLVTAANPYAYRRVKRQSLREARITEMLEKQRKIEREESMKQSHTHYLSVVLRHAKHFKEFHRNNLLSTGRTQKAVIIRHQNMERERKKKEEMNEKERMQRLMLEDEEGYRKLLDEKKDKRLVHLLEQTDEFINNLTGLVRAHQATEKEKKKAEKKLLEPPKEGEEGAEESESEDEEEVHIENNVNEFEGLTEDEKAKRIIEKARNDEDEYNAKPAKQVADYYSIAHRIKEKIFKQHSSLGREDTSLHLKPYQLRGLEWMVSLYNNNLNGILADEMGLGKTIQTIALVTYLMEVKQNNGPYLIIVPLSTISNWESEFEKWAPHVINIIYKGNKDQRRILNDKVRRANFNVLITTYEYVIKEKAILGKLVWKHLIVDEGHRLKNSDCKLTTMLNTAFRAQHRLLLTGTPLQNKLPELWALLNFLLPSIFKSCGTFDSWFNAPFATTGEKVELSQEEQMLIIRRLHKVLRPFLLRRLKKEVAADLPDKTEHVIKCDMSALQRVLYKHMEKGLLIDTKTQHGGSALMNTLIHLRKLCNHPFLFPSVEDSCKVAWNLTDYVGDEIFRVSGKFELLDKILHKLHATGHRVLIFCQMTKCMSILADYFSYRQWNYLRLEGSTGQQERGELLKQFNDPNSEHWLFMLSTKAGGLGLNLQTADTVIIFDSDWNPCADMQAQDRAHRIGQKKEVRVLRLITANSVEEKILAAARHKLNIDQQVIQAGKFDQSSTGAQRRKMLEQIICTTGKDDIAADIPSDEAVNWMVARSQDEFDTFQDMDKAREEELDKPRLVEDSEIPPDITSASEEFAARDLEEENGGSAKKVQVVGRRERKKVDYAADSMNDDEWLDMIDKEEEEEEQRVKKRKEDRKRKRDANQNGGGGEDSQDGTPKKSRSAEDSLDGPASNGTPKRVKNGNADNGIDDSP